MTASNKRRSLEAIADDIRALERGNAFAIGALLVEARDDAEYGEWATWLEAEFHWSDETARNYMAAHRLAEQFQTVWNLPLPMTAVYRLGNDFELDDPDLPVVIEALTEATKGKSKFSVSKANAVIDLTLLRLEHGNYPDATLNELDSLGPEQPWTETAIAKLKAERPTTAEAAEQITVAAHRAHVTSLYAGELPDDVPDDALGDLQDVPEKLRPELLRHLGAAARPLTDETLFDIIRTLIDDDLGAERRKKTDARAVKDIADKAAERAAEERPAAKAQQQVGSTSSAEIERRLARAAELESKVVMLERLKLAQESEIDELKAQKPARLSLFEVLETALELAREAARHDGGLSPGKSKKREKALNVIRSGLALLMELEKGANPQRPSAITEPQAVHA